jgi:transcription elongation factor GreA
MSNFLTKEGLEQMIARRDEINNKLLPQITTDVNNARDQGDLKENAGFQTALKVRDELVAELSQIDEVLNSSYQLIDSTEDSKGLVRLGSTVKIQFVETKTEQTVKIVGSSESNILEGKISNISPLAEAILGQKTGLVCKFKSPQGETQVKILEIK